MLRALVANIAVLVAARRAGKAVLSTDPYELVESGMSLAQSGDLASAAAALQRALDYGDSLSPQHRAQVQFNLALVYQNAGQLELSLHWYDAAARASDMEDAWVKAAWCAREMGNAPLAGGYLKNAVRSGGGKNPQTLGYYGDILNNLKVSRNCILIKTCRCGHVAPTRRDSTSLRLPTGSALKPLSRPSLPENLRARRGTLQLKGAMGAIRLQAWYVLCAFSALQSRLNHKFHPQTRALAQAPPEARSLAATLLSSLGDAYSNAKAPGGKALAAYESALTLTPNSTALLSSLWFARADECRWEGWGPLRRRLLHALEASVQPESRSWEAAEALRQCSASKSAMGPPPAPPFAPSPTTPYQSMSLDMPHGLRKRIARSWAVQLAAEGNRAALPGLTELEARGSAVDANATQPGGPFNLTYVSRRFEDYPGAHLLMGNFGRHSRGAGATVACIASGPDDDSETRRAIAAACDSFEDASMLSVPETAAALNSSAPSVIIGKGQCGVWDCMWLLS